MIQKAIQDKTYSVANELFIFISHVKPARNLDMCAFEAANRKKKQDQIDYRADSNL